MTDEDYMRHAIALAETRVGLTATNPSVGCVIVRDGQIVGEGVTGQGGTPHAEEVALAVTGEHARGATVYVTLEPCAKRSAGGVPCSDRLIAAGASRVVFACVDTSVFADGEGARKLSHCGIEIHQGLMQGAASRLYTAYVPAKPGGKSPLIRGG